METVRKVIVLYILHLPDVYFPVLPGPGHKELVVLGDGHRVHSRVVLVQSSDQGS